MSTVTLPANLLDAAEQEIRSIAEELKRSSTVNGKWSDKVDRELYNANIALADRLAKYLRKRSRDDINANLAQMTKYGDVTIDVDTSGVLLAVWGESNQAGAQAGLATVHEKTLLSATKKALAKLQGKN